MNGSYSCLFLVDPFTRPNRQNSPDTTMPAFLILQRTSQWEVADGCCSRAAVWSVCPDAQNG